MSDIQIKGANKKHLLSMINSFKERSLDELSKITPTWACGQDVDKLYNCTLHPNIGEYIILYAYVEEIITKADFIDVDPFRLFGNGELSDYRVMKLIMQWEGEKHIDPPIIYDCSRNGKSLAFSDGRHRVIVSHHLNIKQIPVALQISDREEIQKIIMLCNHPTCH